MNKYVLKNGIEVEAIPIGKAKMKIGQQNNMLTIVDRGPTPKSKKTQAICQCRCGKYICINLQDFFEGKVKSCGSCYKKEHHPNLPQPKDWTSVEFNTNPFYEYLEEIPEKRYLQQRVYKIRCRFCGKEYEGVPCELVSEKRTHGMNPCPCQQTISTGVKRVSSILDNLEIIYKKEKRFDTCLSPKGNPLRFDFYLPDYNCLIEYDGQQHFFSTFGKGEECLRLQKKYDIIKNNWCDNNSIRLIRIPYYDYKKLSETYIKELLDNG